MRQEEEGRGRKMLVLEVGVARRRRKKAAAWQRPGHALPWPELVEEDA